MDIASVLKLLGENIWIYGGSFIVVLSILVFVHEWGHYIVARLCGVRVEQFSIGFGKEIYGFHDKAGTRWKVSMIPLGGYVQLFGDKDPASAGHTDVIEGEDGETRQMTDAEREVAFFNKPLWQKAAVVFAGPAINFIFAVLLLAGLYMTHGKPVSPPTGAAVVVGSAAERNGFQPHDLIVAIDGKTIDDFSDIRREMLVALDQEKHFRIIRDGEEIDIYARPDRKETSDRFGFKSSIGVLGLISAEQGILVRDITSIDGTEYTDIAAVIDEIKRRMNTTFEVTMTFGEESQSIVIHPDREKNAEFGLGSDLDVTALYLSKYEPKYFARHSAMSATQAAMKETYVMTRSSLEALWQMVVGVRSATELGGIIRIGAIAGNMAQQGIVPLVLLTALLSINLGFINLLPIPMLDGGHLTFYGIEAIIGRPIPEQVQDYAFRAGFVFLIGIMAFANLNDIYQLLT